VRVRRFLGVTGAAAGGAAILFTGFIYFRSSSPLRPRHPNSNNPHELMAEAEHLFWLNNPLEAEPLYKRAEQLFTAEGDSRDAYYARISQIPAGSGTGNLMELSQYLAKELRTHGAQSDPYLHLRLLVVKGAVDVDLDATSSRPVWQEVESLATSLGQRDLASRASGELGVLAFLSGNGSEAKQRVTGALLHAKIFNDVGAEIRYLSLIGVGYSEVDRPQEALKYLDQALDRAAKNPDAGFPKMATIGRVSTLAALGRTVEAQALLGKALEYARSRNLTGYEVDVLTQYGAMAAKTSDTRAAIKFYEQAATAASRIHFLRGSAEAESQLAVLYAKLGDLNKARECAAASTAAHRALGETYELPHHLAIHAALLAQIGDVREAERLYAKAADVTEAMLLNAPSVDARRSVISTMSEVYVGYFGLVAERIGNLEEAFRVMEQARGRVAADSVRSHLEPDTLNPQAQSGTELRLASLNRRLLDSESETERARLMDAIFETEQQLAPEPGTPLPEKPVPLRTLQHDLEPNEVLLEYVLSDPHSYCLVITRQQVHLAMLEGAKQVRKFAADYRNNIGKRADDHAMSERLSAALLKPIAQYLEKTDVVIVPDGILNLIPFDALWREGEGYGLNRHSFTMVPSGTVLHLLRNEPVHIKTIAFLGVSAPNAGGVASKSVKSLDGLGVFRSLLDLRRADLRALPSTETEVKSIAKIFGGNNTVLVREQATESAFKSAPLGQIRVIHLALHGMADSTFPDRSALVFSAGGRSQEDGLLQAREIRKLPISADLVTLSACDAGLGRIEGEEGVSSLVEAFLNAGAKSVVASLWPAEDTYTKSLMEAFYRHLVNGETKRQALRQAKLDMLREFGNAVPPLYWAGFVLVGDGSERVLFGGVP
jgi:CHAT domain-containing protein